MRKIADKSLLRVYFDEKKPQQQKDFNVGFRNSNIKIKV